MTDREQQLIAAIQDIWNKATPYGPGIDERGETYVDKYLIPAGPLHRAKGLLVSLSSEPEKKPKGFPYGGHSGDW